MDDTHESSLTELSATIEENVGIIDSFLAERGLPRLSLSAVNAPARFPVGPEHGRVHHARRQAMDAAKKMHDLLWGPQDRILAQFTPFLQLVPLHFLRRFNILPLIPLDSSISYPALAAASGTHEPHLRRLLRLAFAVGFLDETFCSGRRAMGMKFMFGTMPPPHSSLATPSTWTFGLHDRVCIKSQRGIMDAMEKDPMLNSLNGAGFNVAFGAREGFLEWIHASERKEAAKMFRGTMEGMVKVDKGLRHQFIVERWRWEGLLEGQKVVDVSVMILMLEVRAD